MGGKEGKPDGNADGEEVEGEDVSGCWDGAL